MRRPTAEDRDLADVLRNLVVGKYDVLVEMIGFTGAFTGLARLKTEGMIEINFIDGKVLTIVPREDKNGRSSL